MIGGRYGQHIARQLIDLHQQERDNSLDFACLVSVATLFANRVEFIKEQDARLRSNEIKKLAEARIRFTEITANERVITNDKKWERQCLRYGLSVGCFSVSRRAR